jgi:ectoine hydroxylase
MFLTQDQREAYERDGFVILPGLASPEEVGRIKRDLARASELRDGRVVREKGSNAVRMIYGMNETDGPTGSQTVADLSCSSRLLQSARDVLGEEVYLFHTKCNLKEAITGEIWQWHQDFGVWRHDGLARPDMVTVLLMLDEATELGGCMYFVPGSHKDGDIAGNKDGETTSVALVALGRPEMTELIRRHGEPVPITGGPGTVALFHPYLVHGSGHNMSIHSRWHLYFVYNAVSNAMSAVADPRPSYKASGRAVPLQVLDEQTTPQAA